MHLCVAPAHHLHRAHLFANVVAADFDAVAGQIDDCAAAGLLLVPEPVAVGAGVRLPRAGPEHLAQRAVLHGLHRFERLRRVDQILQIAVKDARLLNHVENAFGLGGGTRQRLGAEHGLARLARQAHGLLVQVVGQADHHGVRLRIVDRLGQVRRPGGDVPLGSEGFGALLRARVDGLHPVAAALTVQGHGVEHADQPAAEHGDFVHGELLRFWIGDFGFSIYQGGCQPTLTQRLRASTRTGR